MILFSAGFRRVVTLTIIGTLLISCDAINKSSPGNGSQLLANRTQTGTPAPLSATEQFRTALEEPNRNRRIVGTDRFLAENASAGAGLIAVSDNGNITLNLVNVPITQAAKAVLGDALGVNYAIQPGVAGDVTLQTTRPLSERALLETFQTILELNGATLQTSNDLVTIVPLSGAARRIALPGSTTIGSRVAAVPLEFIGPTEMIRLLEPIAGSSVQLQPIPRRNILLISGTRDEINAAIDAVNLFDVDILAGKSVGLYRLRAADPEAVVEELNFIFETGDGGSLQNVISFVPSTRLGAVLVVTSRSSYLPRAEQWIRDLDRTAGGQRRRPVVYNLQNRSAVDLAPILTEVLDEVSQEEAQFVEGTPKIVADDTRNAVIVWGNDTEQENFSRLIQTLDATPVQVLLEATIAEVSLNDELNFGLRFFFEQGDFSTTFSGVASGAVGSTFPGLSLLFQGSSGAVALNALASITDVNIVSTPSILVLDNAEARLQIGDEVPIATQQVVDTGDPAAPVVNSISFRDTGIILTVKPRVSTSGSVVLEIDQEVSSVSTTTTSGIDSPTISQRRITTRVVVSDGETLALGGLIEEAQNQNNTKVPLLGDIPVVGALFRERSDLVTRRELLVLITPRVIRNGAEARNVTAELRERIRSAEGLIRDGVTVEPTVHRIIQ